MVGGAFTYQVRASNNPVTYSATGLPQGVTLDSNSGLISGVPTASGTFFVTVIASAPTSEARGTVQISVQPPRITSLSPPSVDVGDPFNYQITASHSVASFSASGLPQGLSLDPSSGVISGTPTVFGYFGVNVTAPTAYGNAQGYFQIAVNQPRFTITSFSIPLGEERALQLAVKQGGSGFAATSPLPPELQLDSQTGVISGIPTLSGSYSVAVRANTIYGPAVGTISIGVYVNPIIPEPLARFDFSTSLLRVDPVRPRVYAVTGQQLRVIDTESLKEIASIPLNQQLSSMDISPDGSKLRLSEAGNYYLATVDLDSLTVLPLLTPRVPIAQVHEGNANWLYVANGYGSFHQVDATTGAARAAFWDTPNPYSYIAMSSDTKTVYVGDETTIRRFDISQDAPVLLQSAPSWGARSVTTASSSH